jgi:hypothetical protein
MRKYLLALVLALGLALPASAQIPGVPFQCGADNIGATLTEMTGCAALTQTQGPRRYFISTIVTQSTTATGGLYSLQSGTGSNCGTGGKNVLPSSVATARVSSPANTSPANVIQFDPAIPVAYGDALCVLGVAMNTTAISVYGYIAP